MTKKNKIRDSPVPLKHLRTTIFHCASKLSKGTARTSESSRSKVNELDMEVGIQDDILVFYISMDNTKWVKVSQGWYNLKKGRKQQGG